mgnify:CR=1 FL=1
MSKADQQFVAMCRDILDHGTTTEGQKVRPVWGGWAPLPIPLKNFGVTARYDLREEFPRSRCVARRLNLPWTRSCGSIKRSPITSMTSTAIFGMSGADETGSIGKAYGYQIGQKSHYAEGDF